MHIAFKRLSFSFILALIAGGALLAQQTPNNSTPAGASSPQIDREEVRVAPVNFINRNNTPFTNQQRAQDLRAGETMADTVVANQQDDRAGITVRRIYNADQQGFGADVFIIKPNATYGHINRIQRVITGYLMKAFEYNQADAEVLSRFILYYNARQRGQMDRLKDRYSAAVIESLDPASAGIDRSYRNWAGRSQIILPLRQSAVRPGGQDLNNAEIQRETGNAPEQEKTQANQVIDNRNRDEQGKLEQKAEENRQQQQQNQQAQNEVTQQQQETGRRIQQLNQDPVRNADQIKQEQQKQEELTNKQEELQQKQEQLKQEEQQIQQQKQEVAQNQQQPAAQDQNKPASADEQKKEEQVAANQQQQPAAQEQKPEEAAGNVVGSKILFLRVLRYLNNGHYNNELWTIDAERDDTLFRGPYANICGRNFTVIEGQGVLVIGYNGANHEDGNHHLVLLDPETLAEKKTTEQVVFWRTPIWQFRDAIYAIQEDNGQFYLARFKNDLTFEARSSEPISMNSDVTFFQNKIYVTGKAPSGDATNIKVFNLDDLRHLKTIDPQSATPASGTT
ncbi:MAG: hypothetical protein K1X75_05825 [Leptospirales bacterium]|nr:hypothetical protein [Leptospirales bacterium]